MFSRKEKVQKSSKCRKMEQLILPNAKLKFCVDQLQNLNFLFNNRLDPSEAAEGLSPEKSILLAKSVTERLVQRLLCGAAQIDPRFSSKYLINTRIDQNDYTATHLEYVIRLDNLSTPTIYEDYERSTFEVLETDKDCPAGYARIRLNGSTFKQFEEFINSFGFLRRDRIQARLVELLAQAAGSDKPTSPLHVDESTMCGIPGKIMDPATLYHVLSIPASQHVYYGPGGNVPRFPDTRDFRLAIVDEPNGIKLKVEFLSPALADISIKVTILVAIGIDSWPATSDFPSRIPLGHSDCLLYYEAALTGMYLVGYGVHSSAWQIRLPAAEFTLLNHYGANSVVRTILDVLYQILKDINSYRKMRKPISYKILNRYMLFTLLLEELEENSTTPFYDMALWSPMYLSTLVLKLLDKAINRLSSEFQPNYFFKKANLLVNPGHLCDEDFTIEANNIKGYMVKLFDESLMSNIGNDGFSTLINSQESEMNLLYKWKGLVENMAPPSGTRGRRLCFAGSKNRREIVHTQYTARQLEYIGLVLHSMLKVKQHILHPHYNTGFKSLYSPEEELEMQPLEDVIYILVSLLDQAKEQYLSLPNTDNKKISAKIKSRYSDCLAKLIEVIRKDREVFSKNSPDLYDDITLVKVILKWLYKAMDQSKKYFAPILRPYLNTVFTASYHVSYHIEFIKERAKTDEIESMGAFCLLVNTGTITPAQGLIDSINKNWLWARDMLRMVEQNTLRLVFIQTRGKVYRHILSLPSYSKDNDFETTGSKTWNDKARKIRSIKRKSTLPGRNYFSSLLHDEATISNRNTPQHETLKSNSPLTIILRKKYRMGQHRCAGDLLRAMTTMQKLSVFQEATSTLPKEDQSKLLDIIDNIHTAKAKRSLTKKWSSTLPHSSKICPSRELVQKYTPKEESAGIRISPEQTRKNKKPILRMESLLGTSRAARLKEDNNVFLLQDNFRIQCLVNKSELLYN
uniref:Mab-21-like HhH/H2TH-like domain-containing protein n=1 Tax=Dendroctonus ponderosae TaxID=77166 RepID=A0AAR5PCJ2_DENPD